MEVGISLVKDWSVHIYLYNHLLYRITQCNSHKINYILLYLIPHKLYTMMNQLSIQLNCHKYFSQLQVLEKD